MLVLITYDVSTTDKKGTLRLNRIAKECVDHGLRVQNSVFECYIDYGTYLKLKSNLLKIMDKEKDSIRFYLLGNKWDNKIEHYGVKKAYNPTDLLLI